MGVAVITPTAGVVTNMIVAEEGLDFPPSTDCILVTIPEGVSVDKDHTWDHKEGFKDPVKVDVPIEAVVVPEEIK